MSKQIKDYLHLYLGCKFIHNVHKGVFELCGYNIYEAYAQNSLGVSTFDARQIKLILRPLSDMTPSEFKEVEAYHPETKRWLDVGHLDDGGKVQFDSWSPYVTVYLLSKGFDLFGLIEEGLAIDKTKQP